MLTKVRANPDNVRKALQAILKDPKTVWFPLAQVSGDLSGALDYKRWLTDLPKMDDSPHVPARAEIEGLIEAYFRMGFWDFAYICACLAYTGAPELPSIKHLIWEGFPGFSRMWIRRGDVVLPVPMTGPIRLAFETWWALSMGYASPTHRFLQARFYDFEEHFRSLDSPIIQLMSFGFDDPDVVLGLLMRAHMNELAYPAYRKAMNDPLSLLPDAEVKDGLVWYEGVPVGIPADATPRRSLAYAPPADAPWGLHWLEAAKESIPPRIYTMALAARRPPSV